MRNLLFGCLLLSAVIAVALAPDSRGCAVARKKEDEVRIASEKAIIVWDEKTRTEHFIRQANFDTVASSFGFLVPTPTRPQRPVAAPDSTFSLLEDWSKPEHRTETRVRYYSLFQGVAPEAAAMKEDKRGAPAMMAGGVQVLDTVKVGSGVAKILRVEKGKTDELMEWLKENKFDARPELTEWLKEYVDRGWYLTAFKYERADRPANGMVPEAVRISFKVPEKERPFYPYREPEDARKQKQPEKHWGRTQRFLRVFFVANGRYEGNLGKEGAWPGQAAHSKPLTDDQQGRLADAVNGDNKDGAALPEGAWLTVFDDPSSPRPGTDEVYFSKSESQDELARPPIIHHRDVGQPYPSEVIGLWAFVGVVVLAGVYIVWRFGLNAGAGQAPERPSREEKGRPTPPGDRRIRGE